VSAGCDGYLRVIDTASGAVAHSLPVGGYVGASPALAGGCAYVGTFENEVLAVELDSERVLWRYSNPERHFAFYSSPAVTEELVLVGGRDKQLHAIDRASGQARWTYAAGARIDASPVVVGDRVFAATEDGVLVALGLAAGEETWRFETGSGFVASPAVAAGRLVVGTLDGLVICLGE
jgi:outer membrane protein assembly factor BamB